MIDRAAPRARVVLDRIYYAFAVFFFLYLFNYFWTGEGGSTLLAMTLVPVTYVLFILNSLRENDLYPRLPLAANYIIAAIYIACALYVAYYMHTEYYELGTTRAGAWNRRPIWCRSIPASPNGCARRACGTRSGTPRSPRCSA